MIGKRLLLDDPVIVVVGWWGVVVIGTNARTTYGLAGDNSMTAPANASICRRSFTDETFIWEESCCADGLSLKQQGWKNSRGVVWWWRGWSASRISFVFVWHQQDGKDDVFRWVEVWSSLRRRVTTVDKFSHNTTQRRSLWRWWREFFLEALVKVSQRHSFIGPVTIY